MYVVQAAEIKKLTNIVNLILILLSGICGGASVSQWCLRKSMSLHRKILPAGDTLHEKENSPIIYSIPGLEFIQYCSPRWDSSWHSGQPHKVCIDERITKSGIDRLSG